MTDAKIQGFHDVKTGSVQYVVSCPLTQECVIIDPVLDYNEATGEISTRNADILLSHLKHQGLSLRWILDTHPHADHMTAAHYLKQRTGAPQAIGERVRDVQKIWSEVYNLPHLGGDGTSWDRLLCDGDTLDVGSLEMKVMHSPGHTIASMTYIFGRHAFIHDTLFMPDTGSARADFQGGSAEQLWESVQAILALPEETRLYTGHDYMQNGREAAWASTVGGQKTRNIHTAGVSKAEFIAFREERDRTLELPRLILPAMQVNLSGGKLPHPEDNGGRYLKIPLNFQSDVDWANT